MKATEWLDAQRRGEVYYPVIDDGTGELRRATPQEARFLWKYREYSDPAMAEFYGCPVEPPTAIGRRVTHAVSAGAAWPWRVRAGTLARLCRKFVIWQSEMQLFDVRATARKAARESRVREFLAWDGYDADTETREAPPWLVA